MIDLNFSGGVDFDELTPIEEGIVGRKYKLPPRGVANHLLLRYSEVEQSSTDRLTISNLVADIMGETVPPKIVDIEKVPVLEQIEKLRAGISSIIPETVFPKQAYSSLDGDDEVSQQKREQSIVDHENETGRLKVLIRAIREEGVTTQSAITESGWIIANAMAGNTSVLSGIFNRKVGAEDKFQQALLTTQLQQEAYAQEALAITRQTLKLAHEIGQQLVHNTSLPDSLKSTHRERTLILDEENTYQLKQALLQGRLEDNLKDLNAAVVERAQGGIYRTFNRLNDAGVDEEGNQRTRLGNAKEGILSSIAKQRDTYRARREAGQGRFMSAAGTAYDAGADTAGSIRDLGRSAASGIGDGYRHVRERGIRGTLRDGLGGLGNAAVGEGGLVRRFAINPLLSAGRGISDAVTETFLGKTDKELAIDRTESLTSTIPDHLSNIHQTLVEINNRLDCVCPKKTEGPNVQPTIDTDILRSPQEEQPTVSTTLTQPRDAQPSSDTGSRGIARHTPWTSQTAGLETPIGPARVITPIDESQYRTASSPQEQLDSRRRGATIINGEVNQTRNLEDVAKAITDAMSAHRYGDITDISKKSSVVGLEKTPRNLMMFPEYRKVAMLLGSKSDEKFVPKDQAVLVDRATEQVALLARMSKKLDTLDGGAGGGGLVSGAMGALLGGAAAGGIGAMLKKAGPGVLLRLLPMALSPPGLIIMGLLAAYLGKDAIGSMFKGVGDELMNEIVNPVKNKLLDIKDGVAGAFGYETERAKQKKEQEAEENKYGAKNTAPTEMEVQNKKDETVDAAKSVFSAGAGGPMGIIRGIATAAGDYMFGGDTDDGGGTTDSGPAEASNYSDSPDVDKLERTERYMGSLKDATGEAYYLPDIDPNTVLTGDAEHIRRIPMLNVSVRGNLLGMAFEYHKATGKKLYINETFRTYKEQDKYYKTLPKGRAAPPGTSAHEKRFAIDISVGRNNALKECEDMGLMRKYGFWRPIKGELWHIEPIGVHPFNSRIRKQGDNVDNYNGQIMWGRGKGGGGAALTNEKSRLDSTYQKIVAGGRDVATATSASMPSDTTAKSGAAAAVPATVMADGKTVGTGAPSSNGVPLPPPPPGPFGGAGAPAPSKVDPSKSYYTYPGMGSGDVEGDSKPASGSEGNVGAAGAAGAPSGGPAKGQEAEYVVKYMMGKGWNKSAAIGIAANLQQESNFNPKAVNPKSGAYGLGQWLGQRKNKDFTVFKKKPLKDSTFDEQLDFVNHELRHGELLKDSTIPQVRGKRTSKTAGDKLANIQSVDEAVKVFMDGFERPGADEAHLNTRLKYAAEIGQKVNGMKASQGTPPPPPGPYGGMPQQTTPVPSSPPPSEAARSAAQPVQSSGFVKVSNTGPSTPVPLPPPPQPQVLDRPEVRAVLDKSLSVQTESLNELKKLNALLSSKMNPTRDGLPGQQVTPAVERLQPEQQVSGTPVRQNTIQGTDMMNVRI